MVHRTGPNREARVTAVEQAAAVHHVLRSRPNYSELNACLRAHRRSTSRRRGIVDSATANTTPSDRAGWTGGDKFGRGAYRLAQEWSEELESDKFQEALSNSGVTTPVTWTWSR